MATVCLRTLSRVTPSRSELGSLHLSKTLPLMRCAVDLVLSQWSFQCSLHRNTLKGTQLTTSLLTTRMISRFREVSKAFRSPQVIASSVNKREALMHLPSHEQGPADLARSQGHDMVRSLGCDSISLTGPKVSEQVYFLGKHVLIHMPEAIRAANLLPLGARMLPSNARVLRSSRRLPSIETRQGGPPPNTRKDVDWVLLTSHSNVEELYQRAMAQKCVRP